MVVLAATTHHQDAITDPAIEARIETLWRREQTQLTASVPGARLIVVTSGHDIPTLRPDAVTRAIITVLASSRKP